MNRNRHAQPPPEKPEPINDATVASATLVAEIRNADLDDVERIDAARLLIRERGVESVAALLALVCGTSGVLSGGAVDVLSDAWALENGLP